MPSVGNTIEATDYNTLQSKVSLILGNGQATDNFGYGQPVTSSQVSGPGVSTPGDTVTAVQMQLLYDDMETAWIHQNGTATNINTLLKYIASEDVIGADETGTGITYAGDGSYTIDNADNKGGINDFQTVMALIEGARTTVGAGQTDTQYPTADSRITSFNGDIDSEFTVTFNNADARRHFFNSGGQIKLSPSVDANTVTNGQSTQRNQGWQSMLTTPGAISMGYNYTTYSGQSTNITKPDGEIGNDGLNTSAYQILIRRTAAAGDYSDSYWQVEAYIQQEGRTASAAQGNNGDKSILRFKVLVHDDGPETNADAGAKGSVEPGVVEPVTLNFSVDYGYRRSINAVEVTAPSIVRVNTFE
jgi:hypothetical protein